MTQYRGLTLLFLVCLLVGFVATAEAQLEIHPRLTLAEEYNDNLLLSNNNEQDDWITTVAPGISLLYGAKQLDLNVDYSLSYKHYQQHSDRNQDDFEDIQRASASANFFAGRPFTLLLNGSITRETVDERQNNADYNDLINKTTVYNFSVAPQYRLELSQSFSIVAGYTYSRTDYVSSLGNDSDEQVASLSLVKQLSSNTEITAGYEYRIHQSDDSEDFDQQDFTLGLEQQFGPRLSGTVEGGYSIIEYASGLDDSFYNWLVDLSYKVSEPLTVTLGYSQSFPLSVTQGVTKQREANLRAEYIREGLQAGAEIYWQKSDYLQAIRYDEVTGSRFDLHLPLGSAFYSEFDLGYEYASYEPVSEDIQRYTAGVLLGYEYRRFLASLGYKFRVNDSDINNNDFQNNVVTLSATLRF